MDDYLEDFLQEAKEYVELMNQNLLKIEKGEIEAVNEVFRVAHTIKGMAGFMNFRNLERLCHALESVLGLVRDGRLEVSEELVDVMLRAVDTIEEIVASIENVGSDDVEIEPLVAKLESFSGKKPDAGEVREAGEIRVDIVLAEDCVMRSVRAALIIESLSEVAEVVATSPSEEEMDSPDFDGRFSVFLRNVDRERVEEVMSRIAEIERFEVRELTRAVKDERREEQGERTEKIKRTDSVRVNISQLDAIMNLVGELVISKGRLLQIAQKYDIPELREAVAIMDKAITSLQDEVMRIRMVKVERVFSKFPRMVRDLARKLGKKVELVMEGMDTELDRTVLDEISDPLVHVLRNAVDHGIETPEERRKAGKDEVGKIRLAAWRERSYVVIEVEDDGRGIDVEAVKRRAVERGLISEAEAKAMSDEEALSLIFTPGFSTKERATEISGRGVGMDVVKSVVEKLGGSLKIETRKGEGTRIRIQLPPTVAIVKALLVKVGGETYAIPISSVVEAIYVGENFKVVHGNPFVLLRGKLIPAFRLRELFRVNGRKPDKEVGIVVEKDGERYALVVDAISEQQEVVIKPLPSYLSKVNGFSGITILGDGRVVPIIDVSSLFG
ncbi:MAG: chemotaxis protein CheA [Archaeoglobaceae archaeon]